MTEPTNLPALLDWFQEDLAALRRQCADLDSRLGTLEARIATLRASVAQSNETTSTMPPSVVSVAPPSSPSPPLSPASQPPTPSTTTLSAPSSPQPATERRSIVSLGLEVRTENALMNGGVRSFPQLITMTPGQLLQLPRFGAQSLADLQRALGRVGVSLPADPWSRVTDTSHGPAFANSSAVSDAPRPPVRTDDGTVELPAAGVPTGYDDTTALPYKFGALHIEDLQKALGLEESESRRLLNTDDRWVAEAGGWYMRTPLKQSWISRRIVEVLNAVKSINIETLYQSIKRVAAPKFIKEGWRMPARTLLVRMVEDLRSEGVHFDIVHEVARIDAPVESREMSGTSKAVLAAFGASHRALSSGELTTAIQTAGMSPASAQLALSASPLVIKLERGIYGLVGRTATMRDIANARTRPEVLER